MTMALAIVPMPSFSLSGIHNTSKASPVMITTVPIGIPVLSEIP